MRTTLQRLEKAVERKTGEKVGDLRKKTIDENRVLMEKKGIKVKFYSSFPFIGRGNILREFISHEDVNKAVDESIY